MECAGSLILSGLSHLSSPCLTFLQVVPSANDEMSDLEYHRLKRFAHSAMSIGAGEHHHSAVLTAQTRVEPLATWR